MRELVTAAGRPAAHYGRALGWTQEILKRRGEGNELTTLALHGAAQFRTSRYGEALLTLRDVLNRLLRSPSATPDLMAFTAVFHAMAAGESGRRDEAAQSMTFAQSLLEDKQSVAEPRRRELEELLDEASRSLAR